MPRPVTWSFFWCPSDWVWSVSVGAAFDDQCMTLSRDCTTELATAWTWLPNGDYVRKLDLVQGGMEGPSFLFMAAYKMWIFFLQNQNWFPHSSDWWVISIIINGARSFLGWVSGRMPINVHRSAWHRSPLWLDQTMRAGSKSLQKGFQCLNQQSVLPAVPATRPSFLLLLQWIHAYRQSVAHKTMKLYLKWTCWTMTICCLPVSLSVMVKHLCLNNIETHFISPQHQCNVLPCENQLH